MPSDFFNYYLVLGYSVVDNLNYYSTLVA